MTPACRAARCSLWLTLAIAALMLPQAVYAEAAATKEYQIKAAFLFNFVRFTEWPPSAFPTDDAPIRIGVFGDDPFGRALDETIAGETVRHHPVVVLRSHVLADLEGCQLVFIARSEQSQEDVILSTIGQKPLLTVSDCDGFASHGGVIGFTLEGNKVRFDINLASAQQKQIKLSAQLLHLGHIVATTPVGGHP